ncbi:MAG: glycosyltransferase family 2 protein [Planctomycetota bacterium]
MCRAYRPIIGSEDVVYHNLRIIAVIPAYNEQSKIGRVVARIDRSSVDTVLVVDDGSTDSTAAVALREGATVLTITRRRGVGAALRTGLEFARVAGFDAGVILAGNNKDDPAEIPRLLDSIVTEGSDFVIGSRYVAGGRCGGAMPAYRKVATRVHPWLISRFVGKELTETTNGFRALRLRVLDDPRIRLDQRWLDSYGLEVYLLWKVLRLGYRHAEVPCTKIYPPKSLGITKMPPVIGWWSILRPIFLLASGLRR